MPGATACCADATGIERRRNATERRDPGGLDLTDDGQDVAGELIGGRPVCRVRLHGGLGGAWIAELRPGRLLRSERRLGAGGNQRLLFFRERRIQVQHEGVGVRAELGDDERNAVAHQAADEMNVATQPIELGYDHRAFRFPGLAERRGQLGSAIEGVGALTGFDLGVVADDLDALGLGEAGDRGALSLDPEPESALALRRDLTARMAARGQRQPSHCKPSCNFSWSSPCSRAGERTARSTSNT
jgi:hypothetical protein